jgi:hypothetical protein
MNEFTVDLPSNTNYLDNTQSDYTVNLSDPIILNKPHKVMLAEFGYRDYMLLNVGKINIKFSSEKFSKYECNNIYLPFNFHIIDNEPVNHFINRVNNDLLYYYSKLVYLLSIKAITNINSYNPDHLLDTWSNVQVNSENFKLIFNDVKSNILELKNSNNNNLYHLLIKTNTSVKFEGFLTNIFDVKGNHEYKSSHDFVLYSEILNFIDFIYVYCDIIDSQYVGDTKAPLLKKIGKTGGFNKTVYNIFTDNDYVLVKDRYINRINIIICDKSGNKIKFGSIQSEVHVKLRFKQI